MATTVSVDPARALGEVGALVYGHFTEHLADVVYDGLWAELVYGRKFETPMVGRREHPLAAPWRPFGPNAEGVELLRGPEGRARHSPSHGDAHHAQALRFAEGHEGGEHGIAAPDVRVDAARSYRFRARVRRHGPVEHLRVALRRTSGEVLAEGSAALAPIAATLHGDLAFDHPTLLWMDPRSWSEVELVLRAGASDHDALLTLTVEPPRGAPATVWFDWVSLMDVDACDGWDARVVELLRDLPVRALKWPGGCMADDYDWRLGIGPRDARHCAVDRAWLGWDENDVGVDEFLRLCALTGAEPYLGVNAGSGTPELAAAFVEYCNGAVDSAWGGRRAAHGHADPYGVRYWSVGNELWGHFERGYAGADGYARRYLDFARAMRAVDPAIRLVAVGQAGAFDREVLRLAGDEIDLLQIHAYAPPLPAWSCAPSEKIRSAHALDAVLREVRRDVAGRGIRVALDEWGWGGDGHVGAAFNAVALNAIHRAAPLVELAARSCVVNVDGVVERRGARVGPTPAYDVFRCYNEAHLPYAAAVDVAGAGIDASALVDPEDGRLSLFVVNTTGEEQRVALDLPVDPLRGCALVPAGDDPWGPTAPREAALSPGALALPPYAVAVVRSW